ncbi:PQQ-binding-like beta-propeller repeat protein [Chitinophaga sp. MM2321]|uniref:outer membrane protein assembly factor BamB family protein n=1 Tax=Chitinophaga sp. MM2321 TaxID=3137178 RepID=UPI0032D5B0D1
MMIFFQYLKFFPVVGALFILTSCNNHQPEDYSGWKRAHGNEEGNKYSSLTQIDTSNVNELEVAWEFHTRDADTSAHSQIQCNPVVVNGIMYTTSPMLKVFAIDAATGKEKWVFSPNDTTVGEKWFHFMMNNNRGVAYWSDGKKERRIFYTAGPYLYALDADSGKPDRSFGVNGKVDLHEGLEMENVQDLFVTNTSAPSVYKDLVLCGSRVSEAMDAAPGDIRAYDVRTGKKVWQFHTIPHPGEPGYETWENPEAYKMTGGANNWMGMTIDQKRGIAYIPLGSAATDFYGGKRRGSNLYADCILALDAATGKYIWHFQYIHHDTWDWDPSSAPVLLTVNHDGKKIDAVAQTTKTGFVFLFDRENGTPLFPVIETPVDTVTELTGERLWPTQPIPQKPAPFVRQQFTVNDINPYLSKEEYDDVKKKLLSYRSNKLFTPQSKQGTVILPGFDGGAEWGGPAVDPETGILYVNANEMAWILRMLDVDKKKVHTENFAQAGARLYKQNCMSCHGPEREGSGNYPAITAANKKYNAGSFVAFINVGRGMMPAFKHLSQQDKDAIASFVLNLKKEQGKKYISQLTAADSFRMVPYQHSGYDKFLTASGNPAIAPPWGSMTAIDLNTGEHVWKTTLGVDSVLQASGAKVTGTENYGGPVVTKGGLLFIAATKDGKFRAFNKRTGKLLWEAPLSAAGFATPATYEVNGKQYVVIACGGGKLKTKSGDSYVAFALPGK